jgi:hypothetical protein
MSFPVPFKAKDAQEPSVYRRGVHDEVPTMDHIILDAEDLNVDKEGSAVGDYKYQPLDHTKQQIRLIRLLESEDEGDPICLYIDTFEISNAPRYTALSYVWGPPTPNHELYIEDERSQIVKSVVRENLYRFLQCFQKQEEKEHSDLYFWIDQLSIDQTTNAERNHQVQMMSDIYSNATSVIVWLGNHYTQPVARIAGCQTANYYDALQTVLRSSYFDRLWVVQEFLLAKRVRVLLGEEWILYGDSRIPWPEEDAGPLRIHLSFSSRAGPVFRRSKAWRNCLQPPKNDRLDGLLSDFADNECHDPLDKIYGLQGLVGPEERLEVDYDKNTLQVYIELCNKLFTGYVNRGCGTDGKYSRAELYHQTRALYKLSDHMGFTNPQLFSARSMLRWRYCQLIDLWHTGGDQMPITIVEYETGEEHGSNDRWSLDFQGAKQYFNCTVSENSLEELVRLQFEQRPELRLDPPAQYQGPWLRDELEYRLDMQSDRR